MRSSEGLRDAWMYLTKNVADPARWIGDTSEVRLPQDRSWRLQLCGDGRPYARKRPAFDQERLAAALSKASGTTYTALRLPFSEADFTNDKSAIPFRFRGIALAMRARELRLRRHGAFAAANLAASAWSAT